MSTRRTYYDILNVKRNCSAADIRKSYVELSKKHHPDVNKDKNSHEAFVSIQEAYSTLVNESKRRKYDEYLSDNAVKRQYSTGHRQYRNHENWAYEGFWEMQRSSNRRGLIFRLMVLPNAMVFASLIMFAFIGGYIEMYFVKNKAKQVSHQMDLKSMELSLILDKARKEYRKYGLEGQLKRKTEEFYHQNYDVLKGSKKKDG